MEKEKLNDSDYQCLLTKSVSQSQTQGIQAQSLFFSYYLSAFFIFQQQISAKIYSKKPINLNCCTHKSLSAVKVCIHDGTGPGLKRVDVITLSKKDIVELFVCSNMHTSFSYSVSSLVKELKSGKSALILPHCSALLYAINKAQLVPCQKKQWSFSYRTTRFRSC